MKGEAQIIVGGKIDRVPSLNLEPRAADMTDIPQGTMESLPAKPFQGKGKGLIEGAVRGLLGIRHGRKN